MALKPIKVVKVPIYGVDVVICSSADAAAKKWGEGVLDKSYEAQVCTMECRRTGIYMVTICYRSPDVYNANNLTHECIHAAWRVLELVGVTVSVDNQEPLAYLAGWLARQVNNFMMVHVEAQGSEQDQQ